MSYRREDGGDAAGRLADRLVDRFSTERVFIDVDAIEPGMDFARRSPARWRPATCWWRSSGALVDSGGRTRPRLDDPDDWVRVEVGTALARGVRVIPVLVAGAVMPRRGDLPDSLADLARRNALRIRHESFRDDAGRLVGGSSDYSLRPPWPGGAEGAGPAGDVSGGAVEKAPGPAETISLGLPGSSVDAERIANSITDEALKGTGVGGVAKAVAATDPGGSPRRAHRQLHHLRIREGRGADGVAAGGGGHRPRPRRAHRQLHHRRVRKVGALGDVAAAVAATDPGRAERIANSIIDESRRHGR